MAQEYYAIHKANENGNIALTKGVFETITEITIREYEQVQLLEATPFKKSISVRLLKDKLMIRAEVKVKYGLNVSDVCSDLQTKVYTAIQHMCEIKADMIDISVVGFLF